MVNSHFKLSVRDTHDFGEMKDSVMYKDYIRSLIDSPIWSAIAREHIEDIDITDDIKKLMSEAKLTASELNSLFKRAIRRTVVGIMADTIILKEISDASIDDVKEDLEKDFKIKYLIGMADDRYYQEAEHKLSENPDTNSVLYRGLVEYYKRTGKISATEENPMTMLESKPTKPTSPKKRSKKDKVHSIDIESDDIRF